MAQMMQSLFKKKGNKKNQKEQNPSQSLNVANLQALERDLGQPEFTGFVEIYKAPSKLSGIQLGQSMTSISAHKAFADYIDHDKYSGHKEYTYGDYGDYGVIAKANRFDADNYYYGEFGNNYYYNDGEYGVYDDGLDHYYTLQGNRGLNRDRYQRRSLLQFGQNEGFMEDSSSWIFATVFVVGFIIVLFCVIGGFIYRRRRTKKRGHNTMKMSDIEIVAVSRDEEDGGSSDEAYAIKMNDS